MSIDYAVMEHADNAVMIDAAFDWDDLGSWIAWGRRQAHDARNNVTEGRALALESDDCIVVAGGDRPVVVLGGTVLHDELSCVGPAAVRTLERYRFDVAVIGAAGLSTRWGITELTDAEAEIQRVAIDRSERLIVIADGSKIGAATNAVAPLRCTSTAPSFSNKTQLPAGAAAGSAPANGIAHPATTRRRSLRPAVLTLSN